MKAILDVLKKLLGFLKRWILDNFWLKVFSLLIAMGLWSYVLTNDATITRERTLTNLYVSTTNQSTFDGRSLALTQSLSDILPQVRVSVEVTQSDYYKITSNNVRVELDLSRVRETGEQTVPLTASTVYGEVTGIYPESVTLDVDTLEKRDVQVEVQLKGASDDHWYSTPTSNPAIITVSGPASQVEQVTNARAVMDLTDVDTTGTITRAVSFTLLDESQNEISYPTLTLSSNSVITSVDAYPLKSVPVETDQAKIITGSVPNGYQIESLASGSIREYFTGDISKDGNRAVEWVTKIKVSGDSIYGERYFVNEAPGSEYYFTIDTKTDNIKQYESIRVAEETSPVIVTGLTHLEAFYYNSWPWVIPLTILAFAVSSGLVFILWFIVNKIAAKWES